MIQLDRIICKHKRYFLIIFLVLKTDPLGLNAFGESKNNHFLP